MKVYTPKSIQEMEGLVGKLVRLTLDNTGTQPMIETFSGTRGIQASPIGVLSKKYPKKFYYEFLHQFVIPIKNGKFRAMDYIVGRLYSVEEAKKDFVFSEQGIFLGYTGIGHRSGYGLEFPMEKEDFQKFKEIMLQNGSWRDVKGKNFSVYKIPAVGSDEFLLHATRFERIGEKING